MFTFEELTVIKMYSGLEPDKAKTVSSLKRVGHYFNEGEFEMKELVDGLIRKLIALSDDDFKAIDLSGVSE